MAVTLCVEIPLVGSPDATRSKQRSKPRSKLHPTPAPAHPPPGGLFADDGPLRAGPQVAATGLLGTRLRSWRLSAVEPGTLVNTGGGDCASALLLAKSAAELARRRRGAVLDIRLPLVGFDGPPTRHRKTWCPS
ncbi:MAG: hypothetical protein GXP62_02445 [Oligoflexia bacterium]|nr:hypothetical protein [Oligoflexia bacterium]